jgi:hypothetical protein
MPLVSGLRPLLAAIDDPLPPDRSQFLLDFIRRAHNLPPTIKNEPRDALLTAALTHLDRARTSSETSPTETLPLPLAADLWREVVFKGRSYPETLAADIIRSRDASLLYYGLLSLDNGTRAWLATDRDLLSAIVSRSAAAFAIASPAFRVASSTVRVPGGDAAVPIWEELVHQPVNKPAAFLRELLSRERGHLAYFYASMAALTEPQLRFAFNLDSQDAAAPLSAARRLFDTYERLLANWVVTERTFWRPTTDPGLLLADLEVDGSGRPVLGGSRSFWTTVFQDVESGATKSTRSSKSTKSTKPKTNDGADLARQEPLDFSWLCEQIFTAERLGDRQRGYAVLFASRLLPALTPATAMDGLEATRAVLRYPALVGALERAGLRNVKAFADAARRAARLSAIDDRQRAERALTQYQGALALLVRAAWRGGLRPDDFAAQVSSLSAVDVTDRGDYDGRLVEWFVAWAASYWGDSPADVYAQGAGPLETDAIAIAAGAAPRGQTVEWEGTRYRVNFARAEALRLAAVIGEDARPFLSAARAFVSVANALENKQESRERLREEAGKLATIAHAVGCTLEDRGAAGSGASSEDASRAWQGTDVAHRCSDAVGAARRAAQDRNGRSGSRTAEALRKLADDMLARGLIELAYAVALGHPDRSLITADDGARRHDFALGGVGPRRYVHWTYPIPTTDGRRGWHMMGSLLGLDVRLADFLLTRVSSKPPSRRPTLDDDRRRLLIEVAALVEPRSFTDKDRDVLITALHKGRERVAALTPDSAAALAEEIRLAPARATLLLWAVRHDRERLSSLLSPTEIVWAGLQGAPLPRAFHAWGGPAEPRLGCLCLRMPDRRSWETFAGRWHSGVPTSGFSDLNIRVTELLSDVPMPAALTAAVLASATPELIERAAMRDHDDYRGLIEFVRSLTRVRVEQYLALLTTDGPLVPLDTGESR